MITMLLPNQPRYRKVVVLCPSDIVTGGPELLHQLVHEIRILGGEASIAYLPNPSAAVPDRYRSYGIMVAQELPTSPEDCIVVPETMVRALPLISPAERIIWWLSYNFFESQRPSSIGRFIANTYKGVLIQALTLCKVKHLFQSDYARQRLARRGIHGNIISDYLSTKAIVDENFSREDFVLYNPKKGMEITKLLRAANPNIRFEPIVNMTKQQVEKIFQRAKVYLDFGEHPGKDRLPREAAALGTVVVVGARGAAANDLDMPLPAKYKLAIDDALITQFTDLVQNIFENFQQHHTEQDGYRTFIASEQAAFTQQVLQNFFIPATIDINQLVRTTKCVSA